MGMFNYIAVDASGRQTRGALEAPDERALAAALRAKGAYLLEARQPGRPAAARFRSLLQGRASAGRADVAAFTHQLASLIEAGVPLDRALSILASVSAGGAMRALIEDMLGGIQGGRSFADCLARHPGAFPEVFVNTVRAGEAGGSLGRALARMSSYMDEAARLRDELSTALIYPLILVILGGGAVLFLLAFVVPRFAAVFEGLGGPVPGPARVLMAASHIASHWFWVVPVVGALLWAFVRRYAATPAGRLRLDAALLRLPVVGPVARKSAVARFSRTLGTLMQSGLPILEALALSAKASGNLSLERGLMAAADGVRKGRGVARPIAESGAFPALAGHMLAVGEETGRLDEMFLKLSGDLEREVRTAVKRLMAALEPAIILLMAVVVGFIVISLVLAVFSLNDIRF